MASISGGSAPPLMELVEIPPPGDPHSQFGISAPGPIVGTPPAVDPAVAVLLNRMKTIHGMGNH